jgi:hypothetical protein
MPSGGMTRLVEAVARALATVEETEPVVRAWTHLAPDLAAADAAKVDASAFGLPLAGLVLGVKDIFDTAEIPTEYGSVIYRGYRPVAEQLNSLLLSYGHRFSSTLIQQQDGDGGQKRQPGAMAGRPRQAVWPATLLVSPGGRRSVRPTLFALALSPIRPLLAL